MDIQYACSGQRQNVFMVTVGCIQTKIDQEEKKRTYSVHEVCKGWQFSKTIIKEGEPLKLYMVCVVDRSKDVLRSTEPIWAVLILHQYLQMKCK
uniref:Uncharacterized protein n=1 Tax=Romanomermis culicivorax TaxID=13658 RepID=A0A915HUJ2_ROMCU